ncbi:response regulator [Paenibacillus sp. GCM10027626]|uniref:response regulator n=1 Tax=Paenibacillus sp. GCM10027626 TaxID=3273411 RepID=UPI00363AB7F0
MFQLLIVDDEPSVVDAIAHTMPWEQLRIDEVYCAYSAREALKIADQHHIDIVITDIRMPGMSGIELIEQIRKKSGDIEYIMLTGYAEFDYAKQALSLQVAEYLLKPVSDEKLIAAITQISDKLQHKWETISSHQNTLNIVRHHLPTIKSELLRNTLEGRVGMDDLGSKLEMLELPYAADDEVWPILIRLEGAFNHYNQHDLLLMEYTVTNIAEEIFGPYFHCWTCKDAHHYIVLVIKQKSEAAAGTRIWDKEFVSRLASRLYQNTYYFINGSVSVVVGNRGRIETELSEQYRAAVTTMRRRIGNDIGLVMNVQQDEPGQEEIAPIHHLHDPPSFIHLFEAGMWREAEDKLLRFFEELSDKQAHSPEWLAELYHTLAAACYHFAHASGTSLRQLLRGFDASGELPSLTRLMSIPAMKDWALALCRYFSSENQEEMTSDRRMTIKRVQEYIHVHLDKDVTLATLADHVHLHPVYLSKIFKLETGEGLKEYLHKVRMDRAIYLLKNSELKIFEITSQVGYLNTAYFIKIFKKQFGMTPQEYRDEHKISSSGG